MADGFLLTCTKVIPQLSIQFGDYTLIGDFYVINLSNLDVVLGLEWLESLERYVQDFRQMQLEFMVNGKKIILKAMENGGPRVVLARKMEALFRHGNVDWATQFFISSKLDSNRKPDYHVDIQTVLDKHSAVFGDIPPGRPLDRGFEHVIEMEEGSKSVITTPYRHPRHFKEEIEKTIKELLSMGHIRPISSPFASLVLLVKKKDGIM